MCAHVASTGPSIVTRARRGDAREHTHAARASALAPYLIQYVRAAAARANGAERGGRGGAARGGAARTRVPMSDVFAVEQACLK